MEITPFAFEEELNNRIELANGNLVIFPNPASTQLTVKGADASSIIRIYDLSGRLRLQESLNTEILNIEMLQSGIYVIEVQSNGIRDTQRLVVSK